MERFELCYLAVRPQVSCLATTHLQVWGVVP
jgi:hypothetical protein